MKPNTANKQKIGAIAFQNRFQTQHLQYSLWLLFSSEASWVIGQRVLRAEPWRLTTKGTGVLGAVVRVAVRP